MLKAGSIYYAVAAALLIALLCGALILLASANRTELQWSRRMNEVRLNASSGLQLLMSEQERVPFGEAVTLDLYGRQKDSVQLQRKAWGLFEVAIAKAFSGSEQFTKAALVGRLPDSTDRSALFLADLDRPLSLCGKTELRGVCFLPEAGVKRAYIEGQSYNGDRLVYGEVRNSERFLPKLSDGLVEKLQALLKGSFSETDSVTDASFLEERDTLRHSFLKRALCFYSGATIDLSGKILEGQIAVVSAQKIIVNAETQLKNVLLAAPQIIFREKFSGQVQAIARDSLILEKEVRLLYPSVAAVVAGDAGPDHAGLLVRENGLIEGTVLGWREAGDLRKQISVRLEKETKILGFVYCTGQLDLKGTVHGKVTCHKFLLSTTSSVYENHLLNAVIDRAKLPLVFAGSALLREAGKKTCAAWVF